MPKKILIVDDEPDIIKVLSMRLREKGYEVTPALDATWAMSTIGQELPDLIILDIMMPGMTGSEFATHLRSNKATAKIPIIFLSALQTKEDERAQGNSVSGNVIFAKPYDINSLIAKIEEMTRTPR